MIKNLFSLLLLISFSISSFAGTIKGVVSDKNTNELLVGVTIIVSQASDSSRSMITGTSTDLDGNYAINLDAGHYRLTYSYVAYESKELVFEISEEQIIEQNIGIVESGFMLESVEVIAKVSRESENILLMDQKKASVSIESIGAKQLKNQGVSDAASGVTKVSGISQQSGSYTINVRGLGDRYNSTTLNNLPLPSNHAEYKNINLELFSTDIISNIGVEKVFTSKIFGDVAGANVNIVSKQQNEDPYLKFTLGSSYNSNLSNTSTFYLQDGPNKWGFSDFAPPAGENVPESYHAFENKWNPITESSQASLKGAIAGGTSFELKNNASINLFATASFDNEYGYSTEIQNKVNGSDDYRMALEGEKFWYNTQSTGMLNLNYHSDKNKIFFNSLILNSSSQDLNHLEGKIIDIADNPETESAYVRRSNYERNLIFVNQLLGHHKIAESYEIDWGLAYNNITNTLPDRRHNIFVLDKTTDIYTPSTNDQANNHRYFHKLNEDEIALNLEVSKGFWKQDDEDYEYKLKLSLGYNGRMKEREFNSYQYNHKISSDHYNDPIDPWNVDAYFNDENYQAGYFSLKTFYSTLNLPVTYTGSQRINAGLVYAEFNVNSKLLFVFGLRAENVYQSVDFQTTLKTGENSFDKMYFLPSLSIRYKLNEKSNLRFAASETYTLPQFKERAPIQFEGITSSSIGNDYLYPSTNYNADLKWESFPKTGELISVTAFGKYIKDPINHFVMSSASNDFTYANTGDWAYVYGLELDYRKTLYQVNHTSSNQKISAGLNLSFMKTEQELSNEKISEETEGKYISSFVTDREELQGAAPLLGNASLSYQRDWNDANNSLIATLVYAYTSDRLYLLGYAGEIGNQIDEAYHDLDFIVKTRFNKLEISAQMKNILNPNLTRIQRNKSTDHIVLQYQEGVEYGISISYKL